VYRTYIVWQGRIFLYFSFIESGKKACQLCYVIVCKLRRKSSCLDVTLRVLSRLELAAGVGASDDAHTVRTVIKDADE
jgi:hypothetical protein